MDVGMSFAGFVQETGKLIVNKQVKNPCKFYHLIQFFKGGFYKCNKFENLGTEEKESKKKEFDKEKSMLENNNLKAENQSKEGQQKVNSLIKELHDKMGLDQQYLQFLNQANHFLIEGRKCLKWTYCFGFYLEPKRKELFEDNQSYLEKNIEILHSKIEKTEFQTKFLNEKRTKDFDIFKSEIVNLTCACLKVILIKLSFSFTSIPFFEVQKRNFRSLRARELLIIFQWLEPYLTFSIFRDLCHLLQFKL